MANQTHIFGSTAVGWAVGDTREEVIKRLAQQMGAEIIKRNVKANGGVYVWTCVVDAPKSAHYEINYYQPVGVHWHDSHEANILNARGKFEPIIRKIA